MSAPAETPAPAAPATPEPPPPTLAQSISATFKPEPPAAVKPPFPGRRQGFDANASEGVKAYAEERKAREAKAREEKAPVEAPVAPDTSARQPDLSAPGPKAAEIEDVQKLAKDVSTQRRDKPGDPAESTAPGTPAEPRKLKVKVGADERELTLAQIGSALQIEEKVLESIGDEAASRLYRKHHHAELAQRAAAEDRKIFDGFIKDVQGDRVSAVQALLEHPKLGLSMREIATDFLAKQYERDSMPEAQREALDAKAELAQFKAERAQAMAQHEAATAQANLVKWNTDYTGVLRAQLAEAKAPPELHDRLVEHLSRERRALGDSYVSPETPDTMKLHAARAMKSLAAERQADVDQIVKGMDAETFMARFPEQTRAIADARIAQFRKNQGAQLNPHRDSADANGTRQPPPNPYGRKSSDYRDLYK